jgi:hypothetical protein
MLKDITKFKCTLSKGDTVKNTRGFGYTVMPEKIEFVEEHSRYLTFRLWFDNFRFSYLESLNIADLLCGDAYYECA